MYSNLGIKSTGSFLALSLVPFIGNLRGRISNIFEKIFKITGGSSVSFVKST